MKVRELQDLFDLKVAAGAKGLDQEIMDGYCGDLLSDVMANSTESAVWMTTQAHQNIVAVAVLKDLAAIILVNGRLPDDETKVKAEDEGIPILLSPLRAYQLAGKLYEAGIGKAVG